MEECREGEIGGGRGGEPMGGGQTRNFDVLGVIRSNYQVIGGQFRHLLL